MTRLAIFDLDGTLIDTVEDLGTATNHALVKCGFPPREIPDYYNLVGRGIYNLFRAAMQPSDPSAPGPDPETVEKNVPLMASYFLPYYDEHKCDKTRPYAGICELLSALSAAGVKLAVASNKYQDGAEKLVRHFFPSLDFAMVLGQRDDQPIKPDPAIVRQIMQAAGCTDAEEVVYVGDSNVDMQTGANAGVRTIGVSWGFRTREELEGCCPSAVVDTAEQLLKEILR
ncbi:MAG: HAD family hydrolase [Candidatus Cryptobacteroides sp.]